MSTAPSPRRPLPIRPLWCCAVVAASLAPIVAGALAERRVEALRRAAAAGAARDAASAAADREYRAGHRALAAGDRAAGARHFDESNRHAAQADRLMREQRQARRFWW